MTREDIDRRFAHDIAHAERTLLREGVVHPPVVVVCRDGRNIPEVADFTDEDTNVASFAVVRLACVAEDAVMVVHRTEAWVVLGNLAPGLAPSQSERRIEVLLVILSARDDDDVVQRTSVRAIIRDMDGTMSGLKDIDLPGGDMAMHGRVGDLLPDGRPSSAERRAVRAMLERVTKRIACGKLPFVHGGVQLRPSRVMLRPPTSQKPVCRYRSAQHVFQR